MNQPKTAENSNNLKRVWMMVEFQNFKKEDLVKNKAELNLNNLESPNASMGCNSIFFKMKIDKNTIKFSNAGATRRYCKDAMELEYAFLQNLEQYTTFKIVGHKLTLTNSKNEKTVFVAQDWD